MEVGKSWTEGKWELLTVGEWHSLSVPVGGLNDSKLGPNTSHFRISLSCRMCLAKQRG